MPQMAPMNWLMIFFMFSMIFMIFNSMNYFSLMYNPLKKKTSFSKKLLNWKW